jgi:prepilin-type N-terminal cleavage/methylation domain-containing protein
MKITSPPSRNCGFTLIELLVVIAIIAILAAMGFGGGAAVMKAAKKTVATNDCTNIVLAIQSYYDDYNTLPEAPEAGTAPGAPTTNELMDQLVGFDKESNPNGERYFQGKDAKGKTQNGAYGGLFYTGRSVELFDAWKKKGNAATNRHYFVLMDIDLDDEITDPFDATKPLYGRRVVVWTTGPDGQFTTGQATATKNRDNDNSWRGKQ